VDMDVASLSLADTPTTGAAAVAADAGIPQQQQQLSSNCSSELFWKQFEVKGGEPGAWCIDGCFSTSFLMKLQILSRDLSVTECTTSTTALDGTTTIVDKTLCPKRSYFCDLAGDYVGLLESAISSFPMFCEDRGVEVTVFPQLRFLRYEAAGSYLAPHVDLARRDVRVADPLDPRGRSTHTMILYLAGDDAAGASAGECGCDKADNNNSSAHLTAETGSAVLGGGETVLLRSLRPPPSPRPPQVAAPASDCAAAAAATSTGDGGESVGISAAPNAIAVVSPIAGRLLLFPHSCPHEARPILFSGQKLLLRGEAYISFGESTSPHSSGPLN
jgi:hypothetical protein